MTTPDQTKGKPAAATKATKRNPPASTPRTNLNLNLDDEKLDKAKAPEDEKPKATAVPAAKPIPRKATPFPQSFGRACYSADFVNPFQVRVASPLDKTVRTETINGIRLTPGNTRGIGGKTIGSSHLEAEMRLHEGDLHVHLWSGDNTPSLKEVWVVVPSANVRGMVFEGPPGRWP